MIIPKFLKSYIFSEGQVKKGPNGEPGRGDGTLSFGAEASKVASSMEKDMDMQPCRSGFSIR